MNELYEIEDVKTELGSITARVLLNGRHPLFSGHFPGQPVMPGVCMMELIRDVARKSTGKSLRITGGPMIKFLNMVDPQKTAALSVEMSFTEIENLLLAEGRLTNETIVFVRFRLELSVFPASSAELPGTS